MYRSSKQSFGVRMFFWVVFSCTSQVSYAALENAQSQDTKPSETIPSPASTPSFQRQVGIGLTSIPVDNVWFPQEQDGASLYMTGLGLDIPFRLHPRVTLELGLNVMGSPLTLLGIPLGQASLLMGPRMYLTQPLFTSKGVAVLPYVVINGEISVLAVDFQSDLINLRGTALLLGGQLGVGAEFRIRPQWAVTADVRAIARGPVDAVTPLAGFRTTVGFCYYFSLSRKPISPTPSQTTP